MANHLKKYTYLALCALLLNLALCSSAHIMAIAKTDIQDEVTQSVEETAANNEQVDSKEPKKPTFVESWRKVITLQWDKLGKADAWNIGTPAVSIAALGAWYFWPNNGFVDNANHNRRPNNPDNAQLLANINKNLHQEIQANIALLTISDFLITPKLVFTADNGDRIMSINDDTVITISDDGIVKIRGLHHNELLQTLKDRYQKKANNPRKPIKIKTHGNKIFIKKTNNLKIYNIITGELLKTIKLSFNPHHIDINDETVAIAEHYANGNEIKIYNLKNDTVLTIQTRITSMAINNDRLITGLHDGTTKIWSIHTGELLFTLASHTDTIASTVSSVAISNDKVITTAQWKSTVKVWDIVTGDYLYTLVNHKENSYLVNVMATNRNNVVTVSELNDYARYVTFCGKTRKPSLIQTWDINTGKLLHTVTMPNSDRIASLIINDNEIIFAQRDGIIRVLPLSINLEAPELAPFTLMEHTLTIPQANFITRANQATINAQDFIIALPNNFNHAEDNETQEQIDGRTYFTFPDNVRAYLRARLTIRK